MLLARMLKGRIHDGVLVVVDADGKVHRFGSHGRELTITLRDRRLHALLALAPHRYLGEAYVDGTLAVDGGTIGDLLALCSKNVLHQQPERRPLERALLGLQRLGLGRNGALRARRNATHHYDMAEGLYEAFLDCDRQYSCAYFTEEGVTLDEAQEAKKRHLAAKLLLRPGMRVLDIGCGWGGLALHLARSADVHVTGITLSAEQLAVAQERADQAGPADRVSFHLRDYREQTGRYDRIVSVGMFEHVGLPHYATFFAKVRDLLADDGIAILHSIGRADGPATVSPWLRKHIFPGSHIPALSEVVPVVERSGLWLTDIEILRLHYAETLRHWRDRFLARRHAMARLYDERFCRMWEFYLAYAEMGFRYGGLMVFQAQLAKRVDAVPLTRDYIFEHERGVDSARPHLSTLTCSAASSAVRGC